MCCQWQQSLCLEFQPSEPRSGITGDHYATLPHCTKTFYVVSREKSSKWKWELGKGPLHTGRRRGGHSRFTWDRLSLPCARGAWCSLSPAPLLRAVHRDCHPRAGGWGEDLARRQRGRRAGGRVPGLLAAAGWFSHHKSPRSSAISAGPDASWQPDETGRLLRSALPQSRRKRHRTLRCHRTPSPAPSEDDVTCTTPSSCGSRMVSPFPHRFGVLKIDLESQSKFPKW